MSYLFYNKSLADAHQRPFSRPVCSVMEDFVSERRLGRIHGRRKRMDVDGQAAVGDQLTTDGDLLLVSDDGEWWLGSTAAKCATRHRRLITEGRGSSSAKPQISPSLQPCTQTGARKTSICRIINVPHTFTPGFQLLKWEYKRKTQRIL